jgi:hypothetical protein
MSGHTEMSQSPSKINFKVSKTKVTADSIFKAELKEFLTRELAEDGYSGAGI